MARNLVHVRAVFQTVRVHTAAQHGHIQILVMGIIQILRPVRPQGQRAQGAVIGNVRQQAHVRAEHAV